MGSVGFERRSSAEIAKGTLDVPPHRDSPGGTSYKARPLHGAMVRLL
jgi:hypothetical protein